MDSDSDARVERTPEEEVKERIARMQATEARDRLELQKAMAERQRRSDEASNA